MGEKVMISVNGQSQVPPGFRFHPTEEELLHYYLRKKISSQKIDLDVIPDVDLNKLEPWDIQEKCKIGTIPQHDWYFFSHKYKKFPTSSRTNRATLTGYWKATGRDKVVYSDCRKIGKRKTLVFYKDRAPHGQRSDWIMHEYRLDDEFFGIDDVGDPLIMEGIQNEGWVICRIFKKKNYCQNISSNSSKLTKDVKSLNSSLNEDDITIDQILDKYDYTGKSITEEEVHESHLMMNHHDNINGHYIGQEFMKHSNLKIPYLCSENCHHHMVPENTNEESFNNLETTTNWSDLDRLVASQLKCQTKISTQLDCDYNVPSTMTSYCHAFDDNLQY